MRGKTMKDKSKKSTYSTTFGLDPTFQGKKRIKKARGTHARRTVSKPANALFMGQRSPLSVCLSGLESGAQGGTRTLMP